MLIKFNTESVQFKVLCNNVLQESGKTCCFRIRLYLCWCRTGKVILMRTTTTLYTSGTPP